ncbi:histidine phosphatase family protein [Defluviimonas sp. WL0050]|uniref:Histidine phosphatase family protein n=1 Tax=Albidovulum litorale TaxID=2984134 RepID=A0ABT2ZPG6_9RHOB|nr:histidine phosphatase family protein [Defluviimonas sp. WL0050]MCV2873045.1 histidine phosphatase family protein [Defluviimonas sp. WL0050]
MIIYLVRHGETATSGQSFAGRTDVAMTERGHRQAQRIAEELRAAPIRAVLTSPLRRAFETAAPVAALHGLVPVVEHDLTEFDFGVYEGKSKRETSLRLRKDHLCVPVPGGESLHDVWIRTGRVADRMLALRDRSCEVVVVGHFWSNRLLFSRLAGLDFEPACRSRSYRPECGASTTLPLRLDSISSFERLK